MRLEGPGGCLAPRQPPILGGGSGVIALLSLKDVASSLSTSIKQIIVDIVDFLTPIITVISVGMIIVGVLLMALRQEFYGLRLIIGGGIGLIIIYLVIPLLLGFL
jgi:hypothetical protein